MEMQSDRHLKRDNHESNRMEIVDFLRGGAMILVLLLHAHFPLEQLLLAFLMPLFFVISGYLEFVGRAADRTLKEFVTRRFWRLLVPYFSFEFLFWLLWILRCKVSGDDYSVADSLISIITCVNNSYIGFTGRLWFLPCMFICDIYVWVIMRLTKRDGFKLFVLVLLLFCFSYATDKMISVRLPLTLDTALFAAAFFLLGYIIGIVAHSRIQTPNVASILILLLISLLYLKYSVSSGLGSVVMYTNSYGEYTVSIIGALSGSIAFVIIGTFLYKIIGEQELFRGLKGIVLWYGKNSLASFPCHLIIKSFLIQYYPIASRWYLVFLCMVFLNMILVSIINHWMPFMLGKRIS